MTHVAIAPARAVLIAVFLGIAFCQALILPAFIDETIRIHPEVAHLATPYRWAVTAGLACLQVALICFWILLSKVQRESIYEISSLHWASVAICASAMATLLVLGLGIHLLGFIGAGGPGVALAVAGSVACGCTAICLLFALRGFLASRTQNRNALRDPRHP